MSTPDQSKPHVLRAAWSFGDRVTVELSLFLLSWGLGALAMALFGLFHWWTVLPVTGVLFMLARRWLPKSSVPADRWWLTIVLLVVALTAVNMAHRGEHMLTGLDSGTYLAVAGWLAEDGSLLVDADFGPFTDIEGLRLDLPGFYDRTGGRTQLEPQFMHAFPAVIGTIIDLAGVRAGLVVPPLISAISLLALHSLARRFVAPAAALLSVVVLGSSLVFTYYARTPFTELLMATFVLSGLSLLVRAEEQGSRPTAALAGALLGGATLVRLDGIVLLLPVTAYILFRSRGDESTRRLLRGARWAMFLVALIGLAESLYIAPAYILERRRFVAPVLLALLLLILANDVLPQKALRGLGSWMRTRQLPIFVVTCLALGLFLAYGWLIRPLADESASASASQTEIAQDHERLELDPTVDYRGYSVTWLTWYYGGAFIVLGFAGAAILAHRGLGRDLPQPSLLVAAILVTFAILYFWRPLVNPYHIWAMRRYVTVVIPLGCLASAAAVESLHGLIKRSIPAWVVSKGAAALLSLALVLPSLAATVPVWDHREYEGLAADIDELCGELLPDAHVLIDGVDLGSRLVQSFRSYCGVPAAWTETMGNLELARLEENEAHLHVVSLVGPGATFLDGFYKRLELTLSRRPKAESDFPVAVFVRSIGS